MPLFSFFQDKSSTTSTTWMTSMWEYVRESLGVAAAISLLQIGKNVSKTKHCNLRGHLQRCQMPDIENSRKTAEKGDEWVTVKQPKNSRNTRKTAVLTAFRPFFRVFRLFFRLFFGCFTATHAAPFSAVFRLFSVSGIWHLCRWPRRLQAKHLNIWKSTTPTAIWTLYRDNWEFWLCEDIGARETTMLRFPDLPGLSHAVSLDLAVHAFLPPRTCGGWKEVWSGERKEHELKVIGPDIFWWGRGGSQWGPKCSVCPSKPREDKHFGRISRDFGWDIPGCGETFEKKKFVFSFGPHLKLEIRDGPSPIWLDDQGAGQWEWMEELQCPTSLAPLVSPCSVHSLSAFTLRGGGQRSLPLHSGFFARSYLLSKGVQQVFVGILGECGKAKEVINDFASTTSFGILVGFAGMVVIDAGNSLGKNIYCSWRSVCAQNHVNVELSRQICICIQ